VVFSDPKTGVQVSAWMKPDDTYVAMIDQLLDQDLAAKHTGRPANWTVRSSSKLTVGGHHALSAVADYVDQNSPGVEFLTWVRTARRRALFFGRARGEDQSTVPDALQQMLSSATIP
jgi:hypothetical protein